MEPLVSVIIVNYNGKKYLRGCFDSLKNGNYANFEVIFVDNGSGDGSIDLVRQEYPWIKVIDLQVNFGLSIASNKGANLAQGKYLFFLNNDTIPHPDIFSELVRAAESNSQIGVCACKNMTYDGRQEVSLGISCDVFGFPFENEGPIFYADAGIFIRKNVFDEIRGFDPKMFLYGEDRDLCWRVLLQGYDIVGVPGAVFYHDSACTYLCKDRYVTSVRKRYLGEYNLIRSMLKNYSLRTLCIILPCYFILSLLEITLFLLKGEFKTVAKAYLPAYWRNIIDLADTWQEHCFIQKIRKVSDSVVLKKMLKRSGKIHIFMKIGMPKFNSTGIVRDIVNANSL